MTKCVVNWHNLTQKLHKSAKKCCSKPYFSNKFKLELRVSFNWKNDCFFQGKVFLAMEATSQLYRAAVPVQPWLYYLVNSYEGVYRVFGFTLAAAYVLCKFWELLERFKVWHTSTSQLFSHSVRLLENISLFSFISKF